MSSTIEAKALSSALSPAQLFGSLPQMITPASANSFIFLRISKDITSQFLSSHRTLYRAPDGATSVLFSTLIPDLSTVGFAKS